MDIMGMSFDLDSILGGGGVTGILAGLGKKLIDSGIGIGTSLWNAKIQQQMAQFTGDQQKTLLDKQTALTGALTKYAQAKGVAASGTAIPTGGLGGLSTGTIIGIVGGGLALIALVWMIASGRRRNPHPKRSKAWRGTSTGKSEDDTDRADVSPWLPWAKSDENKWRPHARGSRTRLKLRRGKE